MTKRPATPLKTHGGKSHLAREIVRLLPPHSNYVEPFAGGLSVLLAKDPEGVSEVVNDVDRHVANFWQVVRHDHLFEAFRRVVEATPFCEEDWRAAAGLVRHAGWHGVPVEEPDPASSAANVARAAWFFVAARQSLAGRGDAFAPLSTSRRRRGMNEQASAWLTAVEGLPAVHARLKRVVVLNRDAVDVVRRFDRPDTAIYADPPYYPTARASPDVYRHEMTAEQHGEFLKAVTSVAHARVAVSGYRCDLYDEVLASWRRADFDVANHAAGGKAKRRVTECLWMNY